MPRLLAIGHVTWDRHPGRDVLGGTVSYGSLTVLKLGWEAGVLTSAGPDFDPSRDLPGVSVFLSRSTATTRFQNLYDHGHRRQVLLSRADHIDLSPLPEAWRTPDALLLGPVAGEIPGPLATSFSASVVGAIGQGWLRAFGEDGGVSPCEWESPRADLEGVHIVFVSEHDLPVGARAADLLQYVPLVALTRGWEGLTLMSRTGVHQIPSLPRQEVDPTGAGDVFAAAFLVRYHETSDPLEAAAFGACAACCAVEGFGGAALGDRAEILRRMALRERLIEEGEWDD